MRSDPRKGLIASLAVALGSVGWFAALWLGGDALFRGLGYSMHAITLLAIFAFVAGLAVAGLFLRLHRVRTELLEGRRVIARWRVDEATFRAFAPQALDADRREKRQALAIVAVFIVVIFGAFALFDLAAAPFMLSVAAGVALLMLVAYWVGQRAIAAQLVYRDGEAIVGPRGLIFNGVLHVWGAPLAWLRGAGLAPDKRMFSVAYAYLSRMGAQGVAVQIPVPPGAEGAAQRAGEQLQALAS